MGMKFLLKKCNGIYKGECVLLHAVLIPNRGKR